MNWYTRTIVALAAGLALILAGVALADYHTHRARVTDERIALDESMACFDENSQRLDARMLSLRDCQNDYRHALEASQSAHVPYLFAFGDVTQ